ncbi:uncharacterized protein HD556DRAFT_1296784 [Suillus plorans]|uniref:Uncharacterized protein n=1 Tax=Suillus plorans TaxID=116603 RepID=A0A9P7DEC1_9AGAM|nr:uncharacterized protein HD556DRAFT_1296784 [Suillus plorans]KAG1789516.1 hypothetical protein HD556DRAFT_1296784 [Suillus plorans]
MASASGLRQPKETNKGKNGFRDRHIPLHSTNPDDLAISRHHFAQYVLASKGSYNGPPLKELKATPSEAPKETLAIVDDKIKELRRQHQEDIELLTAFQAAEYRQEVLSRYSCIDDSMMGADAEDLVQVDYLAALNELYNDARPMKRFQHDMDDALSQIRYNYLKSLFPLLIQRRHLKLQEKTTRRQREAQFPQSIEEYHNIPDRDVQLRIARFLTRSTSERDRMMDEYGWAWRAVESLFLAFKANVSYISKCKSADVNVNLQEGFKNEILESVKDAQALDPRRRPTATPGWQL